MTKEELEKEIAELRKEWRECDKKFDKAQQEFDEWMNQWAERAVFLEHVKKLNKAMYECNVAYQKFQRAREKMGLI